jgi:hypothetical protein
VLRLSRYPAHRGHDDRCVTAPPFDSPTLTVAILDLDKIAAIQSVHAGLDLHAKRFQLQRVFPPPLLECAKRVTHRFAGILVLPGLDDAVDKGVLLRGQAYIFRVGMTVRSFQANRRTKLGKVCERQRVLESPAP